VQAEIMDRLPFVLPSLVASVVLLGWLTRWLRRVWHLMGKANKFFDMVMGSPTKPSIMDEVAAVKQQLAEHLEWHGAPGGKPAAPDLTKPNGPMRRRTS
jgi:hypothetical protein